jgi:2,3-diketo-5-methylthiopentyl-1-phosphate enolase
VLPFFDLPFDHAETIGKGDYLLATYIAYGLTREEVLRRAGGFATGQTIGTWVPLPGVTREMVEAHQARVTGCYPLSAGTEGSFLLRIAFPRHNFGNSFAQMLTGLVGNDTSTAIRVKLIDLELTGAAVAAFPGPRHGVAGLRRLVGVENRPLVMNMIKPCTGYPPEAGARFFYDSAMGGVDLIKDDELLGNTGFSPVRGRVRAYLAAAERVLSETGRAPVYCVNITDRPDRMRDNARAALDAGAKAVMVNFVMTGLDSLASLTDEFGKELYFLGHYAGAGIIGHGDDQGIAPPLLVGRFPRLAGADAVAVSYTKNRSGAEYLDFLQTIQAHRLPLGAMNPVFTAFGGGITPLDVAGLYRDLGPDFILAVGGGIQGHPSGTTAGARAMMQAVKAAVEGIDFYAAAEEWAELREALDFWGPGSKTG